MSSSCMDLREEFRICIVESECMKKPGATFHSCLKSEDLDLPCVSLRRGYAECRRGWMDARTRLRGNSIGLTEKQELEAERKNQYGGQELVPKKVVEKEQHIPSVPKSFTRVGKQTEDD